MARIEDYAMIGDCVSAALISRDGSIDWLCWPRFDSPACFAALLGTPRNGRWKIDVAVDESVLRRSRAYRPGTLILDTQIETTSGACVVTDFMPVFGENNDIVRIVTGVRGEVALHMELVIRFDYGRTIPWVKRTDEAALSAVAGPHRLELRTPVPLSGAGLSTVGDFTVTEGQSMTFVLEHSESHLPPPVPVEPIGALEQTEAFWRAWSDRCSVGGPWADIVSRSLITLKALTYRPTGGIVAAPTTSVPERIGGVRNWDYRFCWLRDATFTLLALMNAGYFDEAANWRDWLGRAAAGSPTQIQSVYGIGGERELFERTIPWLPGFENSTPVRVGNAASEQWQLDVYGEVADALYHARKGGLPPSEHGHQLSVAILEYLAEAWRRPDEGIWEVRGPRRHFTHSKVMAWVAFDRAVKASEELGMDGPVETWRAIRDEIHADVCQNAYDPALGGFVQSYEVREPDASLLLMPLVGFLPASDPRIHGTVEAIERELIVDGFVMRYLNAGEVDGLPDMPSAFFPCNFWLVDNMVLQGRHAEARTLFERLIGLANDVGLLSEEYDPQECRMMGNFPQAFSHVALVNAALNLTRLHGPAEQRSTAGEPATA